MRMRELSESEGIAVRGASDVLATIQEGDWIEVVQRAGERMLSKLFTVSFLGRLEKDPSRWELFHLGVVTYGNIEDSIEKLYEKAVVGRQLVRLKLITAFEERECHIPLHDRHNVGERKKMKLLASRVINKTIFVFTVTEVRPIR